MHLILVADIHLADSPAESFGVDTHANFDRVLGQIKTHNPDHVVMMGDYSLKAPRRQDVQLAFDKLNEVGVTHSFIAGNHDQSIDIAELHAESAIIGGECYYKKDLGDRLAIFLDTAKGEMSDTQLSWLRQELAKTNQEVLVFMHHPPLAMGVPFMDNNHSFRDPAGKVFEILFSNSTPINVFSGHYHTARSTQVGIHSVHICPSTYFQLAPNKEEFAVSHAMPGLRHVHLLEGQVRTWIEFLPSRK